MSQALAATDGEATDAASSSVRTSKPPSTVTSDLWDGIVSQNGRSAAFTLLDFIRIDEDGQLAEHRDSIDWVRVYRSFGMLPDTIHDL